MEGVPYSDTRLSYIMDQIAGHIASIRGILAEPISEDSLLTLDAVQLHLRSVVLILGRMDIDLALILQHHLNFSGRHEAVFGLIFIIQRLINTIRLVLPEGPAPGFLNDWVLQTENNVENIEVEIQFTRNEIMPPPPVPQAPQQVPRAPWYLRTDPDFTFLQEGQDAVSQSHHS